MFKPNDFVFYGVNGVCQNDILYYVLHTLTEPRQTIFNPVNNEKVRMRHVMSKEEASNFFLLLPSLSPMEGNSAKELRDSYIKAIKSGEPTEWGRVMRTYRARLRLSDAKLTRVTDAERSFYENARRMLATEIGLALSLSVLEVEAQLTDALA